MEILIVLLSAFATAAAIEQPITHEIVVTYRSYANPSGRCVDCGGGMNPGCCDVPTPVPQDQTCLPETCDTALTYCFKPLGSTSFCTQAENQQNLSPNGVHTSSADFGSSFFGHANPVRYARTGFWQGIQILHILLECQYNGNLCIVDYNIVIDRIPISIVTLVGVPVPEATYTGTDDIAQLTASIEVRCTADFYGPDCSTQCSNFVSCANCGLSGYTGDHCEINIDDCDGALCIHGNCIDEVNSFRCECNTGFKGDYCETNIDDCNGVNCNHGVCVDKVNSAECKCTPGFTGEVCDVDIDDCEGVDCGNGVCIDEISHHRCECNHGFAGERCDILEGTWLGGLVGGVLGALLVVTILTCALINIMRCWFKRKAKTDEKATVRIQNQLYRTSLDETKMAKKQAYETTEQEADVAMNMTKNEAFAEDKMKMTQNQVYGVRITDKNILQKVGSLSEDYDYVPV